MAVRVSEAIVLRTYPFQEADLIVSFLTRDQGKLRGMARRARRPKSRFGAGLERLSYVRMSYYLRENRELATLDSCELIRSQFHLLSDYSASVVLDYIAEVTDNLLPPMERNERFFRLVLAVLDHVHAGRPGAVWQAVSYFSLWAVRLAGWMPQLEACTGCGLSLEPPERAFFRRDADGVLCGHCLPSGRWELSAESRALTHAMYRLPVAEFASHPWTKETAADLRRFLVQRIERAVERSLTTAPLLESC